MNWYRRLLRRMLKREEDTPVLQALETIRQNAVLQDVPGDCQRDLAHLMHYRDYREEEFVYHAADPGLGLYLVQQGTVRLLVQDEDGQIHCVREVGPNDIFGEESLVGEFRRTVTAQVAAPTRLLGFFRPDLKVLAKRHPNAAFEIVLAIARQLVEHERQVVDGMIERLGRVDALRALHEVRTPD